MKDTSKNYKRYLLTILLLILAFNVVDRFALGVMLQDIKTDLRLSDTQLGFMSGIAFALFYSIMGIPLARWADRGNRVTIISLTAALWSGMVALCGVAGNFTQLLLIRIGVGVGEAGCIPAAYSLMPDYFIRAERPRAAAVYSLGGSLGIVIGYFLAGWLNRFYGWRTTFMLLALPGLALAALAWLTLREPRRPRMAPQTASCEWPVARAPTADQPSLREVCVSLWGSKTFRHLLFGFSAVYFFLYGIQQWQPSFFTRSYGLTSSELGTWFAVVYGSTGVVGAYWGGEWASRYAANNERLQLQVTSCVFAGVSIISPLIYLLHNYHLAFGVLGVVSLGITTLNGPIIATIQTLVPERMRAMAIALIFLFANLIGMGLGPLAAGVLSDALQAWFGKESLRYALLALSPGYLWAAWHFWHASRTVAQDLSITVTAQSPALAVHERSAVAGGL